MDLNSDSSSNLGEKERTLGDGMDNTLLKFESQSKYNQINFNIKPSNNVLASFKPVEPTSQIFNLVPKYIPKERKQPKYLTRKPREPKFIPYEPYKGAVDPIIAPKHNPIIKKAPQLPKSSKNNVEIQELVTQMAEIRSSELTKSIKVDSQLNLISCEQWEKERLAYETDIKNLRETNSHLENQLKFQAQVNSELKTLLVAAVGEDLESRVQHLTEDKLQLARALLNSANHLTSHQEQTEWLSGQCEVWRSKFLASSLMVEELARWKSALSNRINDLQETLRGLLDDHFKAHRKSLKTYCHLSSTLKKLSASRDPLNLKSANLTELDNGNLNLSQKISELVDVNKEDCDRVFGQLLKLPQSTVATKNGQKLLQNPVTISNKQDAICNALMGTAMALSGQQMFLQHPSTHATCCAHCTGEVKNI